MVKIFKIKGIRDFGSLLSASFYYVRRYFNSLGKSVLYFVVPIILVMGILVSQYMTQIFNMEQQGMVNSFSMLSSQLGGTIIGGIAMTALAAVVFNHLKIAATGRSDGDIKVEEIWEGLKSDFFMILLLNIGAFIATFLGMLFFIIPGIFISVKLTLVSAVYVLEDQDFSGAFSRSWNLITNHWWITLGLVIVMGIFVSLMSLTVSMPFVIIASFANFSGLENPETTIGMFYGLVNSLTYIFYTVMYICLGLHYYNLVERKEGEGLEQRIAQIDEF